MGIEVSEFRLRRRRGLDLWWHVAWALLRHYRLLRDGGCSRRDAFVIAVRFSRAAAQGARDGD
jgi:hypothetical protein